MQNSKNKQLLQPLWNNGTEESLKYKVKSSGMER